LRQALNNNPVVQRIIIGGGIALVGLLLVLRLSGGGDSESPEPAADLPTGVETTLPGVPPPGPSPGPPESVPSAPPPGGAGAFVVGKGLPAKLAVEYARDKVVVLLVVKKRGIDDRLVEESVARLRARDDVAVFVTPVKEIARYSRITAGVNVSRTPALVVMLPRSRTNSVPTAFVRYGFRDAESAEQAVEDALYEGPTVPYHPG